MANLSFWLSNNKIWQIFFLTIIVFCIFTHQTYAATRTWDGGGGANTNWSTATNWSNDTLPESTDDVVFDGTSSNNSTIDASFAGMVQSISINSGYAGTITQARSLAISQNFSQSAGTFSAVNQTLDITESLNLSNGNFTASSGTTNIGQNFNHTGGNFSHNSGNIIFNSSQNTSITCNSTSFNTISFTKSDANSSISISSGCSLSLFGNNPSSTGTIVNNGTINVTGNWTITGSLTSNNGSTLTMTGDTFITTNNLILNGGSFPADITTMSIGGSLDNSGNLLPDNIDLTLNNSNSGITLTCGTVNFATVEINKTSSSNTITIDSSCNIDLAGTNPNSSGTITNNGTININGNWSLSGSYTSNTGASLTSSGSSMSISQSLIINDGSFPNSLDLTLSGNNSAILTCNAINFSSVSINRGVYTNSQTISADCNIPLAGVNPSITGSINNNGTISASGNLSINGSLTNENNSQLTVSGTVITITNGSLILNGGTFPQNITTLNIDGSLDDSNSLLPDNITLNLNGSVSSPTIHCGDTIFASINLDKDSAANSITPISDCNLGNFTITQGYITNPSSTYTYHILGNFSQVANTTIGGSNFVIEFAGSNTQSISKTAGTFASVLQINKIGSNMVSLTTSLTTVGQSCILVGGIFDLDGYNFSCGSTLTLQNGSSLRFEGTESVTVPVLNDGSTIIYKGDGDSIADNINLLGWTYKNLSIALIDTNDTVIPGEITTLGISGDLNISSGGFTSPTNLNVTGNFVNNGTFNHNNGTVTLNGDNQAIGGSTVFYNLTKTVNTAATLTFPGDDAKLQTIAHTLTLKGASDNLLSLVSSFPNTQWHIDPQGTRDIEYLNVSDSYNENTLWIATYGLNITNGGNNSRWIFGDVPSLTYYMTGVNAGTLTNGITTNINSDYNSLPFNNLAVSSIKYAAHRFTVTSTAQMGYTISMKLLDQLRGLGNPENIIDPFAASNVSWTTPQVWTAPNGTVANVNTGWIGANTSDTRVSGWEDASGKFGPVSTISHIVMYSPIEDLDGTTTTITYAIEINSVQPTDIYNGEIVYDIIPTY